MFWLQEIRDKKFNQSVWFKLETLFMSNCFVLVLVLVITSPISKYLQIIRQPGIS